MLPEDGQNVPPSVRDAVAAYFEDDKEMDSIRDGRIKNWPGRKRTSVARGIALAATSAAARSGNPNFIILDAGEGQTPEMMPLILLSLARTKNCVFPLFKGNLIWAALTAELVLVVPFKKLAVRPKRRSEWDLQLSSVKRIVSPAIMVVFA